VGRDDPQVSPLGDCAIVVGFGDDATAEANLTVRQFERRLDAASLPGVVETVPAFTTVTIVYDPIRARYEQLAAAVGQMLAESPSEIEDLDTRTVGIPVHYGGDFGPDLGFVASHNELTEQQVIEIHSQPTYLVYMIGFAPGFPYLGGMSERIAAPRRDNPRASIPVGSVGVAGRQTGVYSIETPGGWQLIGRTPLRLFRPEEERPSLLEAGDEVRFDPITRSEYDRLVERDLGG
jgi:inhibitor of KinA